MRRGQSSSSKPRRHGKPVRCRRPSRSRCKQGRTDARALDRIRERRRTMSKSVAQTVDSLPRSVSSGTEADMAEQPATVANVIEIRVEEISQLFNALDPFPFREKDLDK